MKSVMTRADLTNEKVVDIYMDAFEGGLSLTEVAKKYGVTKQYLDWRAKRLRHVGVKLPKKYTAHEADVEALNLRIANRSKRLLDLEPQEKSSDEKI